MKLFFSTKYLILVFTVFLFFSCNSTDDLKDLPDPISPVIVDLSEVPYQKLSDYHFFEGAMKEMSPSLNVVPYVPASELFTDYALKKRFVWMPKNTQAEYITDYQLLDFPVGAVLIKNFYYNNLQPNNQTKIIETRVMIKKESGWIFAEYVWNEAQEDAFLDMNGSFKSLELEKPSGEILPINYRIPSETECLICHKLNESPVPIGLKPQNLNLNYNYDSGSVNQLEYLKLVGYLASDAPTPSQSTVNYKDENLPIDLRLRSYLDINCAHCHQSNSHCDYRPIRLAFNETSQDINLGICVNPDQFVDSNLTNIITPRKTERSMMYFRLNSTDDAIKMPLIGRSVIHQEGVELLEAYINSLQMNCQ